MSSPFLNFKTYFFSNKYLYITANMVKIVAGNHITRQILLQLLLSLFVLKNILIYMQAHNITCDIENA